MTDTTQNNLNQSDQGQKSKKANKNAFYKAQMLILLCGLILSLILSLIVDSSIKSAVSQSASKTILDVQKTVRGSLGNLEKSMVATSEFLSHWDISKKDDVAAAVQKVITNFEGFSRVFWVRQNSNGQWVIQNLYESDHVKSQVNDNTTDQKIINHFIRNIAKDQDNLMIITDFPGQNLQKSEGRIVSSSYPFWTALTVGDNVKEKGVVIAHMNLMWAVDKEWLQNRDEIYRLVINDLNTKKMIYNAQKNTVDDYTTSSGNNFVENVGGNDWQVEIMLGKTDKAKYLGKLPWFAFFLGALITICVALYFKIYREVSAKMEKLRVDVSHKSVEIIKRKKDRARLVYKFNNAENEYRNLINTATDVIFELDKHGNILFISKAWERLLGHEAHEVLDKRLSDFIHDEMRSKFEEKLFKIFTYEDKKYSGKLKIKNNEGHYRNIGIWMSLLSNDHPEHEDIIVGSISDAEEALRAKEALSLAEQKAQSIIENAAGGFYQMTLDGKFLSVNPSMAHILGYDSPEHLMRQKNDNLGYVFGTLKDKNRFMRELESSGHVSNFETKIYTKRGHEIWVNENARAVKNDIGEIEYIEGSMENVTQRKMVEMDLKEAMVASDLANRSKSEFLANMSHELRTPLNSIIGFAEIMKNEVLGAIENKQYKDYANDIYDSGNRLLKIINEILDVSRIESGERQLNETQIDMDDLIKNSLEFISARYESSKLTVINACEGRVPSIVGEERAIKQILLNLMSNAMKFTPAGGRVTIMHELDANGALRVSITDTGVGLNEDEIAKALSPFGQVDTALSRSGSGAGLGLNLVDALISIHGGKFELFSEKGIGTTATLIIPSKRVLVDSEVVTVG